MTTKATLRRSGRRLVTVKVTAHLSASQLAALLWHGCYEYESKGSHARLSAAYVRKTVAEAMRDHGESSSYSVENDDYWELHGGQDWAIDQVMRVYGFTEADLEPEDRQRRAQPRVGDRVENICPGPRGYGHGVVIAAAAPDGELWVKYDDGTTQLVPVAWLARETES
ncbi:MAG TPA: hypothetical protein VFU74_21790 [Actinocrinis sp.]|nr:hypothetical protein [Actinocrinis sp.]